MNVKELLLSNNYWVLNKQIVKEYGVEPALLLSVLAEANNLFGEDWFFQTAETIKEMTGISSYRQTKAIGKLENLGIINQKNRGIPMKRYFKINYEVIEKQVFKKLEKYNSKNLKTSIQETLNNKESIYKERTNKESTYKEITENKPLKKKKCFVKPKIEEIKAYCSERKNNVDPERFYDFYESKGWLIGKNKMKDWKAAIRTWERGDNFARTSTKNSRDNGTCSGKCKEKIPKYGEVL